MGPSFGHGRTVRQVDKLLHNMIPPRIKARVAIEETIRVMMEKGADDEAIEKATLAMLGNPALFERSSHPCCICTYGQ